MRSSVAALTCYFASFLGDCGCHEAVSIFLAQSYFQRTAIRILCYSTLGVSAHTTV